MSIVLDVIIIAIVALVVWRSAKHGFVRTVVELVGYVAALLLSVSFSSVLADGVYGALVRPSVAGAVEKGVGEYLNTNLDAAVDGLFDKLPGFLTELGGRYHITEEGVKAELGKLNDAGIGEKAGVVADYVAKPIVTALLGMIFTLLLFLILLFLVRLLAKLADKAFSLPVLDQVNGILGGVIGVPKGVVFAVLFVWLLGLVVSLTENGLLGITRETIDGTMLFRLIYGLSPFAAG